MLVVDRSRPPRSRWTSWRRAAVVAPVVVVAALCSTTAAVSSAQVRPVALVGADPAIGLWQRGATILDVQPSGEVRYVADPVACRVGQLQGKDFTKAAEGSYTVSDGNFTDKGCTAGSFAAGFGLRVSGDTLSAGSGSPWTRVKGALAPTDAVIGRWTSPDGTRTNEVQADGAVRIVTAGPASTPACRVGQLDSYGLKSTTTTGTYTARDGDFTGQECTARSFARTATLTLSPDGKQLGVAGQTDKWLKVIPAPAVPSKDLNSVIVIHHNLNGHWVPCGMVVFNKTDEVQQLLTTLGLESPGIYDMDKAESAKLDKVMLRDNADNPVTEDLYKPLLDAANAAAAGPVGGVVPVATDGDATKSFKAVCVRRT